MFPANAADTAAGSGSLVTASGWLSELLQGQGSLAVASIAVAVFGMTLLAGRIDRHRALWVVLGIAIAFGAPALAAGLLGVSQTEAPAKPEVAAPAPVPPSSVPAKLADPYAGASVPG